MFENCNVTQSFKNSIFQAIRSSKLSHALIFEGSDDSTRLSAAKELAKAILCTGEDKPCGICNSCEKCDKGCHPDIHILSKAEDSTMIKVDEVRDIKAKALVFPNEGSKSVFIIHGAHYMNVQAQNALLKIFEEPSSHVCFILTCDSKASLLDTVISRATSYTLAEEKNAFENEDEASREKAIELINSLMRENEYEFLRRTAVFLKDKALFKATAQRMLLFFRDALILQSGGKDITNGDNECITLIKNQCTQRKTLEFIEKLNGILSDFDSSANLNLTITRFSSVLYGVKIK